MSKGIRVAIVMVIAGAFPALAWGQAGIEYGMAASKSAGMVVGARSAFDARAKQLGKRVQPKISSASRNLVQENRQALEQKSGEAGGTIRLDSVPEGATVSVDGAMVGYTPTDLKVPEGSHVLELKRPEFLPWRQEISVTRGGSHSVKAELASKYKSEVTIPLMK